MTAEFPDVEVIICDLIEAQTNARAGTRTPADLTKMIPFARVRRIGGNDDEVTDYAQVDVDTFARTRDEARQIAVRIHTMLRREPDVYGPAGIDRAYSVLGVFEMDEDNPSLRRFHATYRVTTRRH